MDTSQQEHRGAELASAVVQALSRRGETLATCESLTAGLCSSTIASVPGASTVLRGGLVTYATELKVELAGVPEELVNAHGVVSEECARAMAVGTRTRCRAHWAVSLTGVAGPDPQDGHPAGTVFIGIAGPGKAAAFRCLFNVPESLRSQRPVEVRQWIRQASVTRALELLLDSTRS